MEEFPTWSVGPDGEIQPPHHLNTSETINKIRDIVQLPEWVDASISISKDDLVESIHNFFLSDTRYINNFRLVEAWVQDMFADYDDRDHKIVSVKWLSCKLYEHHVSLCSSWDAFLELYSSIFDDLWLDEYSLRTSIKIE